MVRNVLKTIGLLGVAVITSGDLYGRNPGEKPNVVLIMADDVSWECFGCYGAEDYETPNIDALAAEGVRRRSVKSIWYERRMFRFFLSVNNSHVQD